MATLTRWKENAQSQDGGQTALSMKTMEKEEGCKTRVATTTTGNFRIHGAKNGEIMVLFAWISQVALVSVE